jgi:tetratricopeptide (TPR) repeat protein
VRKDKKAVPQVREKKCLLVLPFVYIGYGDNQDKEAALVQGLAEVVSAALGRGDGMQVVFPSMNGNTLTADIRWLGKQFGATLLLRGTVRVEGSELRVTYTVIACDSLIQVAAGTLDGRLDELFAVEDQLVEAVLRALRLRPGALRNTATRAVLQGTAAHERYLQALGYLQRHDNLAYVDGAISILESLIEDRGETGSLRAALARAYLSKFHLTHLRVWEQRAATACERALALQPRSPEVLLTHGELHCQAGRYREAIHDYERALKLNPEDADALLGLARACDADGRDSAATEACLKAVALRPNYWGGYSDLGRIHFNHGRFTDAIEAWKKVVEITPDNARGFSNLGAAYHHLGRWDEALAAYRQSLQIHPNSIAYSSLGTVLFFLARYEEAAAAFERGAALRPDDPEMWGNLGDAYRWMDDAERSPAEAYSRAISLMRECLRSNPRNGRQWVYLADWLAKNGQKQEALQAVRRALRLCREDAHCVAQAVRVYHILGDTKRALECVRRAAEGSCGVWELEKDPELHSLREHPAFSAAIGRAVENGVDHS